MIGVAVRADQQDVTREFFELCKTSWEFWRPGRRYDVLISTGDIPPIHQSLLVLIFSGSFLAFDQNNCMPVVSNYCGTTLAWAGRQFPIYCEAASFPMSRTRLIQDTISNLPAFYFHREGTTTIARIGFDLFAETAFLLTSGQPVTNAHIPSLEFHVELLRYLIVGAGVPFVEIPPVPAGHAFMACLTHDIDHPALANHRCDRTMFGFLHRSTIGSTINALTGRIPAGRLLKNWVAAAKLPLLHLGLTEDPWRRFDRYLEIEAGLHATYFALPIANDAGKTNDGPAPSERACRYGITEITPQLRRVHSSGCEVGVHGLDAWRGAAEGRKEHQIVFNAMGATQQGIRIHWLYFDRHSPQALEEAGFSYDSSIGYNEVIGYRAGTTQVYRPPGAKTLLELPLHVMDTALFSRGCMRLSEGEAFKRISPMIDSVAERGGVLTLNWHDRSIAPERLWEDFYIRLLAELKRKNAWFPTAVDAIGWFAARRSCRLEYARTSPTVARVRAIASPSAQFPKLRLRVYRAVTNAADNPFSDRGAPVFSDTLFDTTTEITIPL